MSANLPVDIPPSWADSAALILRKRQRKVLVVGAADRGKSTYCQFLAITLVMAGFKVAFVDADIGQKDIGPPATVSLGYLETAAGLSQSRLAGLYFVGSTNPIRHFLPIVIGTRRLVDAARAPFVIIDTTGLIQGAGRMLTSFQIESLQPDRIVAIEKEGELGPLLKSYRQYPLLRLRSSPQARPKSREARRAAREHVFRRYFADAAEVTLDLKRLSVQHCLLFNGRPCADPRFVYAETTPEGMIGISADPMLNCRG
ncbi:MAG TPA: Clp1/GlmU family protein [Candidatus Competibacteraceae bacterium]|nr:Clp1/GlmU family protein [Candidatus Competibacteraceae bacterium]